MFRDFFIPFFLEQETYSNICLARSKERLLSQLLPVRWWTRFFSQVFDFVTRLGNKRLFAHGNFFIINSKNLTHRFLEEVVFFFGEGDRDRDRLAEGDCDRARFLLTLQRSSASFPIFLQDFLTTRGFATPLSIFKPSSCAEA